jgi:hypothetical protein
MEYFIYNYCACGVRRATMHGREHIVAPLTMIRPGVLHGSKGPLLYPAEEISRNHEAWNGMPIVVYHPDAGMSARDPRIADRTQIGRVFNARITDNGTLKAEGWFDVEDTRRVDPRVLRALESGQPLELSTGLYTDNEPAQNGASYKGRPYDYIARNYKPDHLAVLPDQVGACSIQDGCGVLVNSYPYDEEITMCERTDVLVPPTMNFEPDAEQTATRPEAEIVQSCSCGHADGDLLVPPTLNFTPAKANAQPDTQPRPDFLPLPKMSF